MRTSSSASIVLPLILLLVASAASAQPWGYPKSLTLHTETVSAGPSQPGVVLLALATEPDGDKQRPIFCFGTRLVKGVEQYTFIIAFKTDRSKKWDREITLGGEGKVDRESADKAALENAFIRIGDDKTDTKIKIMWKPGVIQPNGKVGDDSLTIDGEAYNYGGRRLFICNLTADKPTCRQVHAKLPAISPKLKADEKAVASSLMATLRTLGKTSTSIAAMYEEWVELEIRLIVACHQLDVEKVNALLKAGVNVNAVYGDPGNMVFMNQWTLGWPASADRWTPLLAVINANDYPDPPRKIDSTEADLAWARQQMRLVPQQTIDDRRAKALAIVKTLIAKKADINVTDSEGATPLYDAISSGKVEIAKLLIASNANVNTKTGVYIDGPGDQTPLHKACWSAELTKLLLEKGANPRARDTRGQTPADYARQGKYEDVLRLYQKAR